MKHVFSVASFVVGALCFAVFLITMKPDVPSAVTASSKPARCNIAAFWCESNFRR